MKRYSKEWKETKQVWVQDHKNIQGDKVWKVHYIENGCEYSYYETFSKRDAEEMAKTR